MISRDGRKHLNDAVKAKIVSLKRYTRLNNQEIAQECQCSESTVKYWWSRYQSEGNVLTKPRPGQPNKLSPQQKQEVIDKIEDNPFLTATELAPQYNVSYMTIISVLNAHGLHCRTAATQTRLTEEHKINRMAFCETLLEKWDEKKLNSIIFSDEKTFCSDIKWKKIVYRPINKRYDANYTQTQHLSGRISAGYFGAISINGPVTDIVKINGKFNSNQYLNILRTHILPVMQRNSTQIFMQDNSPIHKANKVMNFLQNQPFETMLWCPYSPDLNPIENVWSYLIHDWPQMENRNEKTLHELVKRKWLGLYDKKDYFKNLYKSLPRRCEQIIELEGNWCKY